MFVCRSALSTFLSLARAVPYRHALPAASARSGRAYRWRAGSRRWAGDRREGPQTPGVGARSSNAAAAIAPRASAPIMAAVPAQPIQEKKTPPAQPNTLEPV